MPAAAIYAFLTVAPVGLSTWIVHEPSRVPRPSIDQLIMPVSDAISEIACGAIVAGRGPDPGIVPGIVGCAFAVLLVRATPVLVVCGAPGPIFPAITVLPLMAVPRLTMSSSAATMRRRLSTILFNQGVNCPIVSCLLD